ncbi:MAG: aminotransferase class I/II-fold pyridoxal phosphate-dependent enzyme [Rhodospirillaceae bacterium]|nr:aminotransferase class I/II-fold pyridoxal phosphate-dependent enzyme [Rhodospirillaceae bacterium]
MSLFQRFEHLAQSHRAVKEIGADPFRVRIDRVLSPTEAMIGRRRILLAGTNNYLGLTFDAGCISAATSALESLGTGTTGSSIANGHYGGHRALEQALAAFFEREHGMVFTTGYQANLGIISTVAGPDDYLLIDADSHASIYDACKMGQATVIRFRHNDPRDLDRRLARLAHEPGNKVVVVEGIYSMLGDQAPLREIVEVKKRHGAYLIVDEAHSFGVLGATGRGLAEAADVEADVDMIVGTFSKSLGAVGGFCVSSLPDFNILRVACRPYMFTASLPPSVIASVRAALETIRQRPELRSTLWDNVHHFYDGLARQGFILGEQKSPIVAVRLPSPELAVHIWHQLLNRGVYVNLALPPATPANEALLRCSVCAAHTKEQLSTIIDKLTGIAYDTGLLEAPARVAVS